MTYFIIVVLVSVVCVARVDHSRVEAWWLSMADGMMHATAATIAAIAYIIGHRCHVGQVMIGREWRGRRGRCVLLLSVVLVFLVMMMMMTRTGRFAFGTLHDSIRWRRLIVRKWTRVEFHYIRRFSFLRKKKWFLGFCFSTIQQV